MTAAYAYAVMRGADAAAPADVQPLGGGPLSIARAGGLAVLIGEIPPGEVRRTRRNLLAHLRVLEAAMAQGPLLPMRFGVVADDAEAVAAAIAPREAELSALLTAHDGLAEYGLRVSFPREPALAALGRARPDFAAARARIMAGRASAEAQMELMELGRRVAEALDDRRKQAQRALLAALKPLARDHVLRAPEDDVEALRAEFLLPVADEAAFAAAAETAAAALDFAGDAAPTLKLVGPAPAYNFVSLALDAPAQAA